MGPKETSHMGKGHRAGICVLWTCLVFSSPERSGRAIVLPPASALASASTNFR